MINRVAIILLITGAGHLFSIFTLKFVSQHCSPEQISAIAGVDAIVLLIIYVIALGLQPVAMRNISISDNWKEEYIKTQSARVTLGIFMAFLSAFAFINPQYLVFLFAPFFALSGDYALYARGYPIAGSLVAFFRLLIPFSLLVVTTIYFRAGVAYFYAFGIVLIYLTTNFFIARFLKTKLFFMPRVKSLSLYAKSLSLGLVSLSFYFLGVGILLVAKYLYPDEIIAVAFIGLKLYVIFKSVLRVIHQAFMKDMLNDSVCLKIDQLSILTGLLFGGSVLIFPETFISLMFGKQFVGQKNFFVLLGCSAITCSLFLSLTTKSLLEKKDKGYTKVMGYSMAIALASVVILSYVMHKSLNSIAVSILLGETVISIGLVKLSLKKKYFFNRIRFLFLNLGIFIVPLFMRIYFQDTLITYLSGFIIVSFLFAFFHYKKFKALY